MLTAGTMVVSFGDAWKLETLLEYTPRLAEGWLKDLPLLERIEP